MPDGFRRPVPGFATWTVCVEPVPCAQCPTPCRLVAEHRIVAVAGGLSAEQRATWLEREAR
jgi:hypothetical protein